ncbi:hypothetical protein LZ30DRAFT_351872 [Colletotrichum cereale]|nr:hypothetical protein LZ30DRAFT_351872 [Colletotrichum cereale]
MGTNSDATTDPIADAMASLAVSEKEPGYIGVASGEALSRLSSLRLPNAELSLRPRGRAVSIIHSSPLLHTLCTGRSCSVELSRPRREDWTIPPMTFRPLEVSGRREGYHR